MSNEALNIQERIHEAIKAEGKKAFDTFLEGVHAADIAEVLDDLDRDVVLAFLDRLDHELEADVLVEMDEDVRSRLLTFYTPKEIAEELVENMDSDDAADLLQELAPEVTQEVLSQVDDVEHSKNIAQLLTHEEDTAGALMATEMIKVNENWTVLRCVAAMRQQAEEVDKVHAVYVVDDDDLLLGTLSLKKLLTTSTRSYIKDVFNQNVKSVLSTTPAEEVANIMQKYDLFVIPVTTAAGQLLGKITLDDVVDFIREEAERDYQLASGLADEVESSDTILEVTRARIPWLLIGLLGGLIVALIINNNESDLLSVPALAYFMPLIAAMAGNVGVQSSAIVVQALAGDRNEGMMLQKLSKELLVGLVNGTILAVVMVGAGAALGYENSITMTVSIALLVVIIFASLFGTFVPLMLNRFKIDPALATGPFITTANDVIGLIIYFQIGRIIIGY